MTISEAQILILSFFTKKNIFIISKHFSEVITLSEDKDIDIPILEDALKRLEDKDIVKKICYNKPSEKQMDFAWVLVKPLISYSSTIELSGSTVQALSELMDIVCERLGAEEFKVNILNITEKDIQNILFVLHSQLVEPKK